MIDENALKAALDMAKAKFAPYHPDRFKDVIIAYLAALPKQEGDGELCGRCSHPRLHHAGFGSRECQAPSGCDCFEFVKPANVPKQEPSQLPEGLNDMYGPPEESPQKPKHMVKIPASEYDQLLALKQEPSGAHTRDCEQPCKEYLVGECWLGEFADDLPYTDALDRPDEPSGELAEAIRLLRHMNWCAVCGLDWDDCEEGRKAYALLAAHPLPDPPKED